MGAGYIRVDFTEGELGYLRDIIRSVVTCEFADDEYIMVAKNIYYTLERAANNWHKL